MSQPASSGHLLHNLVLFGRVLRGLGLDVSPGRVMDLMHALEYVDIGRKADFYHTARSLLVHRREDIPLFDEAFELFWHRPVEEWFTLDLHTLSARQPPRQNPRVVAPPLLPEAPAPENTLEESDVPVLEITRTYSAREVLRHKDFGDLTEQELAAIQNMIAGLVWRPGERRTRRYRPGDGARLDLRRTMRRNLRYGGEWLEWALREPKYRPRSLVVIADISGSMERYTRLVLHFLYTLAGGLDQQVETFVFGTHLTRITRQLQGRDIASALMEVSEAVTDWSGGTRIGEALRTFNYEWGRRVLGRGAVVLLISDGWDRGNADLLRQEMARLRRSSYRLIWLNPLLGSPEYEPLTRGMQAALPYLDDFLPVHNLSSLEDLADHLASLQGRQNGRRQIGRLNAKRTV
jgi:hypothetical protein